MSQKNVFSPGRKQLTQTFLLLLILTSFTSIAEAQVLAVSSVSATVAETDHTALAGEIQIWVYNGGLIAPGTINIDFGGVPITNSVDTGITALGANISVNALQGTVTLTVQSAKPIISVGGIRFDIAGTGARSVDATFSAPTDSPYTFTAGSTRVPVIGSVLPGLAVASDSNSVVVIEPGANRTTTGRFTVVEGYRGAFTDSDAIGNAGQTVATLVEVVVEDLPDGVTISFPDVVISPENGARLTVLPNYELVLPTSTGDSSIKYSYTGAGGTSIESFPMTYTVAISEAPAERALVYMQATLLMDDPDEIPYYEIQLMPSEDDLPFPQYEMPFPVVMAQDQYMGIALTNSLDDAQDITLTLLDRSGHAVGGANITNPVVWTVPAGAQEARPLEDPNLFGSGILNPGLDLGTVVAVAKRTRPVAFFLSGNNQNTTLDGATIARSPLTRFILPYASGEGQSPYTALRIFNPSADAVAKLSIVVRDSTGVIPPVTSPEVSIQPRATLADQLSNIVNSNLSGIADGYIEVASSASVFAVEVFGNSAELNIVNAQDYSVQQLCWIPHFAVGGGYETELDLIYPGTAGTAFSAQLLITAYGDAGQPIPGTGTVQVSLAPQSQKTLKVASLLGINPSQLTTGSLLVEVLPQRIGPIGIIPSISGTIRFKSIGTGFSAALPLRLSPQTGTTYAHVAENASYWTGLALLNPQASAVTVTVDVFGKAGNKVGTNSFSMSPKGRISRLLPELVAASQGQEGGYFRVTATAEIISLALFGDGSFQSLAAIPAP